MTNSTINPNNQSAASILLSNSVGVGATTKLAEETSITDDNLFTYKEHSPVKLTNAIMQALLIKNFDREFKSVNNIDEVLLAYSEGYIGTAHKASVLKGYKKTNPLVGVEHVLTKDEYHDNCIKHGLSREMLDPMRNILNRVAKTSSSSTKTDLLLILADLENLFFNDTQRETIEIMAKTEAEDAIKFEGLTSAGFAKIARSGPHLAAHISLDRASAGLAKLMELGFNLVSNNVDTTTMLMQVVFNEDDVETNI